MRQLTERRTVVEQALYGETDPRLRATWRVLFLLAVFAGLVVLGDTILSATGVPPVITELKLPYLAAVAGAVVVAVRLGDRSASGVGFGVNAAWLRDLAAGVGMGLVFQCAVTMIWAGTDGLTVTDTTVRGVATGPSSLILVASVSLFGVLVTAVFR
jgi:hypothetical protein